MFYNSPWKKNWSVRVHLIRLSSHVDHLEERVGFLETIIYENQIQILGNAMASSGSAQLIDLTDFESSNDN